MSSGQQNPTPAQTGGSGPWRLLWLAAIVVAIIWVAFALFTPRTAQRPAVVPYSTFVTQVQAGDVASVRIAGDAISGTYKKSKKTFTTTYPATVRDPTLMPLLQKQHVKVTASASSSASSLVWLAWLPLIFMAGFVIWILIAARKGAAGGGALGAFGRARPRSYTDVKERVTFNDVAGADEAKAELQEEVDFLRHPEKYREIGARIPRGVLLFGPPGTGKTLLARAVAGEAGVPFLSLSASEFVEMFVGVGASRVRDLFAQAKQVAPAIVFIDELDAVGRRRGAGIGQVNDEREQTLNQLLGELDGFDRNYDVIMLAATNRPDVLDPALLRPGRFDRQITVELPDRKGREGILHIHLRKIKLARDVDLARIASATIGLSGAELANLCNEAALGAARRNRKAVTKADFEEALDKIRLGAAHPHIADPQERRVVAYHESGHTIAAWLTPGSDPVQKVTIMPRGRALGVTEQIPAEERHNFSASYLHSRLVVMLGGRAAEELAFGESSTGAEKDLVEATSLARRMVTSWGMGELGLLAFKSDEEQPFLGYEMTQGRDYSEDTAARIDRDVERLLDAAYQEVHELLTNARPRLDRLAETLLRDETVELDALRRILGQPQEAVRRSRTA